MKAPSKEQELQASTTTAVAIGKKEENDSYDTKWHSNTKQEAFCEE